MVTIETIETSSLGDRSYLAHDGEVAIVIDPQRDIGRVLARAAAAEVRITHVFETHIHNDYVTGGLALAAATGAAYVVSGADDVAFPRTPAADKDVFVTGRLSVQAIATPGHTPNHLAYALSEDGGAPSAVFTGGSMLFGAVGRTDLIAPERTEELTRAQYRSVRRLAGELPPSAAVHPTHGFGSFCSATETSGDASTLAEQAEANIACTTADEDAFVATLLAGFTAYPRYYAHMGPLNRQGPTAAPEEPVRGVDAAELRRRIADGEWVVDLRERRAFAHHHVRGTISVELGDSFATFLGWTKAWETPLSLIGESAEQVDEARRQLTRIGIDELEGAGIGTPDELGAGALSSYRVASFADLGRALGDPGIVVLDVRRPDEWAAGHLAGALHIPFWELEERVGEVPAGEVWVHCATGFRSSIAASLLQRAGRHQVVYVDDEFERVRALDLPLAR